MCFFKRFLLNRFFRQEEAKKPSLQERFQSFQELLHANNEALELMGDMDARYFGENPPLDRQYIRATYHKIRERVYQMVESLNQMVPDRYARLYKVFEQVDQSIQKKVFGQREIPISPLTLSFAHITQEMNEKVGGKNANLGEMRNRLDLPVPDGYAITSHAYRIFIEENVLDSETKKKLGTLNIHDPDALSGISGKIRQSILSAQIPPVLEEAILGSYDQLARRLGMEIPVSVRSSAVREDSDISFAGQYATALNVRRENLLSTYKEILASKFTPQAIFYWKEKGFSEEDIPMAVGCQAMIPAKMNGVMYSQDPNRPDRNVVIISAIWGLGELSVDGQGSPNVYLVSRESGKILEKRIPKQEMMFVCREGTGIVERPVPEADQEKPCLDEEGMQKLFHYALKLEAHYQKPQDIEWAIDPEGKIYILQTRLLKISSNRKERKEKISDDLFAHQVLIDWGVVAAPGAGTGPVYLAMEDRDLDHFPPGGVLVVKRTSPKYITVMNRASAIITDVGNVTGHMASLAREYQVPTIVDTKEATKILRKGQVVTVDALRNRVFDGVVEELISKDQKVEKELRRETPVLKKWEGIHSSIVRLNLVDPKSETFIPERCRTFHDLTRFIHETSILEMFRFNELEKSPGQEEAKKLMSDLPINLYVIDLGGGLVPLHRPTKTIQPEDFASWPLKALWRGLTHPDVRWTGVVEVDLKGFASVMINTLSDSARYGNTMGERSYALISKEYMNFSSRLAYHFSTVDAYCSQVKNNNYITFHFMGGGSSSERRSRRARFIGGVLENLDFDVEIKGDWLLARLMKYEWEALEEKLDYLGRLMCCARQLDMVMYSDHVVDWYIKAFLKGNYAFEKRPAVEKETFYSRKGRRL
jgi:pyruvate,water dikinase